MVHAVAPYWGQLRDLIRGLKYDGETHNAAALGHLLFQHLQHHVDARTVDLVLPNPTEPHRGIRHTELLVAAVRRADVDGRWPFDDPDDPCLVKTHPTVRSYGQDPVGRRTAAEALERALLVARPERVAGSRILVIDDVVTTSAQLNVVAKKLYEAGASRVTGLVLAASELPGQTVEPAAAEHVAFQSPAQTALQRLASLRRSHDLPSQPGPSL